MQYEFVLNPAVRRLHVDVFWHQRFLVSEEVASGLKRQPRFNSMLLLYKLYR